MGLIFLAIDAYSLIVLATAILSWFPDARSSPAGRWLERVTNPVLAPIRRVVPLVGGFDVSPVVLLAGLLVLKRLIAMLL